MVGSLIINILVYTHNGGFMGTFSIGLKSIFLIHLTILLVLWQLTMSGFTDLVVHQKTKKYLVYTPMFGSTIINVMVYALFGGSPKLKVKPFTLIFIG